MIDTDAARSTGSTTLRAVSALRLRTGVRAGGYGECMAYCDQERLRCFADPSLPNEVCEDRYPVCQNACTVCGITG